MPERSVVTRYEAKIDGYLANVAKMKTATVDFAKAGSASMAKHSADWDKMSKAATVGGLAIGAAVVLSAKAFMDFEAAMSVVGAAADATARQQKMLGEAAIQAGQDTVFSATEAAKAEAELVKAGVSVADILGGALTGSLDLAAAGQIGLAESATIAAQAMNIFDKGGKDVGHIADVLTAGANKSAAGVDDLGMALQQGGLVAKQTGLTLEDTVGTLAAFADNALKGSDAGTALRTMLGRLNPTTDDAKAAMADLGLNFYDAQGSFIGITAVAGQLQQKLGTLSAQEKSTAIQTIFGQDAQRGANILIEQGEAGLRKYISAVDDQGAAARMAARQTDNLKGDIEQLKGTLESAFIRGGAGGNDGLRSVVQDITGMIDGFNKLSPAAQASIVQIAGVTAATLLVAGAGIKATTSVLAMKASMDAAGLSGGRLTTTLRLLGGVVAVVGVAALAHELGQIGPAAAVADVNVDRLAKSVAQLAGTGRLTGGIADLFREDNGVFGNDEKWVSSAEAIERFSIRAQNALGEDLSSKFRRIQDFGASGQKFTDTVSQIDAGLASMVRDGHADEAKAALDHLLDGISDPAVRSRAAEAFTQVQAALDDTSTAAAATAGEIPALTDVTYDAAKAAKDAADGTKTWADELNGINSPILNARDAARKFEEALDEADDRLKKRAELQKELREAQNAPLDRDSDGNVVKGAAKRKADEIARLREELAKYAAGLDITTEAGRANQAVLDGIAQAALDNVTALQENGASQATMDAALETSRTKLAKTAESYGMSKKAAREYAEEVLKTPASVSTTITAKTDAAEAAVAAIQRHLNALHGKDVNVNVRYNAGRLPNGGRDLTGGITKDAADGHVFVKAGGSGALVKAYADGGLHFDTSLGAMQPQIIPSHASRGGLLVAEQGAGPWEGFVSGNPSKAPRSRRITEDIASRLGGEVTWYTPLANGAVLTPTAPGMATTYMPGSRSTSNDNRLVVEQLVTTATTGRELRRDLARERRYQSNRNAS